MEKEIDSVLLTDPEVRVALARRALSQMDLERASTHAGAALQNAPLWPQAYLTAAEISLARAFNAQTGSIRERQESLLTDALTSCTKGLEVARTENDKISEIALLTRRVDVHLLLKQIGAAEKDAEEARGVTPDDPRVLLALGQVRAARRDLDGAIGFFAEAYTLDAGFGVAFLYGKALCDRSREGDLESAINALRTLSVPNLPPQVRAPAVTQVLQCYFKQRDWAAAKLYLDEVSPSLDLVAATILRGQIAWYEGSQTEAVQFGKAARADLASDAAIDTIEALARFLMLIGDLTEALPLWQRLFDLDAPGFDHGQLLDCAARLRRDEIILKTCDELHARGSVDWQLLEFEIQYLQKYDIELGIKRLRAFIDANPGHGLARLCLSILGVLLDRSELVTADLERIPSVDSLPPEYVIPAIQVLRFGGDPAVAVDYAYRYLRGHFSDIQAHQALQFSMMPGASSPDIPATLDVAGPGTAVCFQEDLGGEFTWVVLEDTQQPVADFEEIPLSSSLAVSLLGKRVNDIATLAEGSVQNRTATVKQIVPKEVRRYQDVMMRMQLRFGSASPIESVRFGSIEDGTAEQGLALLTEWAKKRAEFVAETSELYRNMPITLHLFGSRLGQNAFMAIVGLACEENEQIKCCLGTPDEIAQAAAALQTAKGIVVDLTALATLRILGLTKVLSTTRYKFILSQKARTTLHEMLTRSKLLSAPGATISYQAAQLQMQRKAAENEDRQQREDEEFILFVEQNTEYRDGTALAAVEPTKRDTLERALGQYGAEAAAIASDPAYVLWTDDVVEGLFAVGEFGVKRAWTQVVLGSLSEAGLISSAEYEEASARLLGMGYSATLFDPAIMIAGFRLAGWSPAHCPAKQFLKVFADPTGVFQSLFGICVSFIEKLYREAIPPNSRCEIAQALFDAVAMQPAGVPALKNFRKFSARVFGLNTLGQQQFDSCFDRWLDRRNNPLMLGI